MNSLTSFYKNESSPYVRWTLNERIQHWLLAGSFILLVLTGFGLKYPDAWWVQPFSGIEWLFDLRGLLHRITGGLFLLMSVYHIIYMIATKRGRQLFLAILPRFQDLKDSVKNISYNFGLQEQPPQFGHFSYMEKVEYFALIWGVLIMAITGLMLWFKEITLSLFPKWVIELVTVIHLYEAWLATLAIVIWHFYYVIFNPDVYPINTSMLNGKITEKEMKEEYYLEWHELQRSAKEESISEKPDSTQIDKKDTIRN